jgi:hypothetical protein
VHACIVRVKQQEDRTNDSKNRKDPGGPRGGQFLRARCQLNCAQGKQKHGKCLVLHDLVIGEHALNPGFRTKRPEFGIAENQDKSYS